MEKERPGLSKVASCSGFPMGPSILWSPVVQSPWLPEPDALGMSIVQVSFVCFTTVFKPWLFCECQWKGLTLRLNGREDWS